MLELRHRPPRGSTSDQHICAGRRIALPSEARCHHGATTARAVVTTASKTRVVVENFNIDAADYGTTAGTPFSATIIQAGKGSFLCRFYPSLSARKTLPSGFTSEANSFGMKGSSGLALSSLFLAVVLIIPAGFKNLRFRHENVSKTLPSGFTNVVNSFVPIKLSG